MRVFFLIILCFTAAKTFAHDYYFAHAEVAYNDFTGRFETTLTATTHDLELELSKGADDILRFEQDEDLINQAIRYINDHFILSSKGVSSQFKVVGKEVQNSGLIYIYMESDPIELGATLDVRFDFLMETFEDQQNKITFLYQGKSYTEPFMGMERTRTINIEKQIK